MFDQISTYMKCSFLRANHTTGLNMPHVPMSCHNHNNLKDMHLALDRMVMRRLYGSIQMHCDRAQSELNVIRRNKPSLMAIYFTIVNFQEWLE